jgi:phospho-N-acetylmuramoyl-pentapeptide-transferase
MIRLLLAASSAMIISLFGTRFLIRWLIKHNVGQPIREDGPEGHITKAGTPTMGGIAIVGGAVLSYFISNLYRGIYTRTGIFVMMAIAGAGVVGLLDDYLKVKR